MVAHQVSLERIFINVAIPSPNAVLRCTGVCLRSYYADGVTTDGTADICHYDPRYTTWYETGFKGTQDGSGAPMVRALSCHAWMAEGRMSVPMNRWLEISTVLEILEELEWAW